jgi:hypothetical protein
MQKGYFCPEENTKPSHSNCATWIQEKGEKKKSRTE